MTRLLFAVLVVIGALYLVRWFLSTPAENVAATLRKSAFFIAGIGLIALAATGKLHWLFAFLGAAIPFLVRHAPYLFRMFGLYQTVRQNRPPPGARSSGTAQRPPPKSGMSKDEALAVLGLQPGATQEAIIKAHRELIQKLHPDRGGSTHLASQINEAKRVLLET